MSSRHTDPMDQRKLKQQIQEINHKLSMLVAELPESLDSDDESELQIKDESTTKVRVDGFNFPLNSMIDIERLEEAVRNDSSVRDQYVHYISSNKPPSMDIVNFFSRLFTDEALISYNYSGVNNIGEQKMPMRNYSIFTDCMIDPLRVIVKTGGCLKNSSDDDDCAVSNGGRKYMFIISRKGGILLVHENYIYRSNLRRQGRHKNILYWECSQNRAGKCRGRVKSVGDYLYISNSNIQHNHEPEMQRISSARLSGHLSFRTFDSL
ncbi:uncharacterized protein LOC129720013 isoform X2 [Wyeomyia smithii]|nr:uncharacterized protein LOC129720013 isoform X2 [Wyeomyia smithii]